MFNQFFFAFALSRKNNGQKIKKDKNKKGNISSGSVIELLLTLFLGTSGSLSRQSSRMNDILKKGRLQKNSLHQNDPYLLLESAHIQ